MAHVTSVRIKNYRSVCGPLGLAVPLDVPLVLIGENNAGKSNIIRAIELVLGESWPGNHDPDDHEYYGRSSDGDPIDIRVGVEDVPFVDRYGAQSSVAALRLICPKDEEEEHALKMIFGSGGDRGWVPNDVRTRCLCVVVGADRRLSWHLSYTSKWTLLSKLMRQFHKSLSADADAVSELKQKFAEITAIFQGVEDFAAFERELADQVERLSANLEYGLSMDFSAYDPSNFFHALRVQPTEGAESRTFDELGTGQEQILAIAFAHAYAKAFHGQGRSLLLVVEEPEAHLHPLAQRWLAMQLRELARADGIQVVLTTHSPAFVRVADLPGLVVIRKTDGGTSATQLTFEILAEACRGLGAERATVDTVGSFYEGGATQDILSGLFARKLVLVEGPTEAAALPVLLAKVDVDLVRDGIAVIPVGGVGSLAKWLRFFTAYGIPAYVIFDNDVSDDGEGVRREDLMNALQLDDEASTTLTTTRSVEVQSSVAAFGVNFEESLRGLLGPQYEELETQGRETHGLSGSQSKPLLARFVADRIAIEPGSEADTTLRSLAAAIADAGTHRLREP